MDQSVSPPSQRRKFLMVMVGGLGGLIGLFSAWPVFRFLAPFGNDGGSATVTIARSQVPVGAAHFFQYQGRPAVVLQPEPGNFVALSAVCTHLGCVVSWEDDKGEFLCPCHGGRFSPEGAVLAGPPPKPLEAMTIAVEGDQLMVG